MIPSNRALCKCSKCQLLSWIDPETGDIHSGRILAKSTIQKHFREDATQIAGLAMAPQDQNIATAALPVIVVINDL
jgi:hypothetical protein